CESHASPRDFRNFGQGWSKGGLEKMRQALHIFKKDVRHLWFEITMVICVVAAFTFTGSRRALWLMDPATNRIAAWTLVMILLPLTWWTLIARVIHDEALPGDSRSEEHTSELQSRGHLVCRPLLEK